MNITILISIAGLVIAVASLVISRIVMRRVRVLVHRAHFVQSGGREPDAYFITVTNLSLNREVEITHIWFDTPTKIHVLRNDRPLPKRLKVDETWSTWKAVAELPVGLPDPDVYKLARVRLSNGRVFRSKQNKGVPELGSVPGGDSPKAPSGTMDHLGVTELRHPSPLRSIDRPESSEAHIFQPSTSISSNLREYFSEESAIPGTSGLTELRNDLMPHGMKHLSAFVSHSTQDHMFVERFAADLRAKGIDAWYSAWEIKPGDSIRAKIDEGLKGCEYFIIVLSKSSIARPWVQTELDAATIGKLNGKVRKIIPIKIEDCGDLPPTLSSLCWEDFSNQPYHSALAARV